MKITKRGAILRAHVEPHILQKNFGCHMTVRMSVCLCQAQSTLQVKFFP